MAEILFNVFNGLAVITLNRPAALNALTLTMVKELRACLEESKHRRDVNAVLLKGAGTRAFCAGGDIKNVALAEDNDKALVFFREEYALNRELSEFPKTTIVIMDGYTFGGGVGLAMPCQIRIATEATLWAMPETEIGFFPDVGGSFYLNQLPSYLGRYFALTGDRIKEPGRLLHLGLATHYVNRSQLDAFYSGVYEGQMESALHNFHQPISVDPLFDPWAREISEWFSKTSVEEICAALIKSTAPKAQTIINTLQKMSPTSLKLAYQYLEYSKNKTLKQVLQNDLKLAEYCIKHPDFKEGIRAKLIDKDNAPVWVPATLDEISNSLIEDLL